MIFKVTDSINTKTGTKVEQIYRNRNLPCSYTRDRFSDKERGKNRSFLSLEDKKKVFSLEKKQGSLSPEIVSFLSPENNIPFLIPNLNLCRNGDFYRKEETDKEDDK